MITREHLLVSVSLLIVSMDTSQAARGDNRAEFLALCEVIAIAEHLANGSSEYEAPTPSQQIEYIISNMSSIQGLINKEGQENQSVQLADGETYANIPLKTPLVKAHAIRLKMKISKALEKIKGGKGTGEGSLKSQIEADQGEVVTTYKTITQQAKKALYGESGAPDATGATTVRNTITQAAKANAGISLANDVAALCKSQSSNECVDASVGTGNLEAGPYSDAKTGIAVFGELKGTCTPVKEATPPSIRRALDKFKFLVGKHKDTHKGSSDQFKGAIGAIFGKRDYGGTEDCELTRNVCVNYADALNGKGIAWFNEMVGIQKNLEKVEKLKSQINKTLGAAKDMETTALHELGALYSIGQELEGEPVMFPKMDPAATVAKTQKDQPSTPEPTTAGSVIVGFTSSWSVLLGASLLCS